MLAKNDPLPSQNADVVNSSSSLPTNFDVGTTSWVLSKPIWNTCPI
jgi:hypothetical protein